MATEEEDDQRTPGKSDLEEMWTAGYKWRPWRAGGRWRQKHRTELDVEKSVRCISVVSVAYVPQGQGFHQDTYEAHTKFDMYQFQTSSTSILAWFW